MRWPGDVGEWSLADPFAPSSNVIGDTSVDTCIVLNAWLGPPPPPQPLLPFTGVVGDRSAAAKLNGRLNSFSKLPRMRAPALRFESLRPYGFVWVTMVGRVAPFALGGPLIGRRGSRLNLLDESDGAIVGAFASSIEWSGLPDF